MSVHPAPMLFSEAEMRGAWPWPDLDAHGYDLIMVDPPWGDEVGKFNTEGNSI